MAATGSPENFLCQKCLEDSSHSRYHILAKKNAEINKMERRVLVNILQSLNIDAGGSLDVLKKRLKSHHKTQILKLKRNQINFDYLCVIDFEATCESEIEDYPHEIIEFPAILIDTQKVEVVDEYRMYCKPKVNPILSEFCKELTGITQEIINGSEEFPQVLKCFENWLYKHKLGSDFTYAIVTDGPCDLGKFLKDQCKMADIPFPSFGEKWINIRKSFSNFYKTKRMNIELMLEYLGLQFEGTLHCGLHDSRNIAHIVQRMINDGAHLRINDKIEGLISLEPKKSRSRVKQEIVDKSTTDPNDYLGVDPDTIGFEKLLLTHK